jgi:curved DNA-binding protein CbpA
MMAQARRPSGTLPMVEGSRSSVAPESGKSVLETLHAELFRRQQLDDYGVLDLQRGADDAAIRAAYLQLSRRYHPHRYARYELAEYRQVATEIYVLVQRAFARLSREARMPVHDESGKKRSARRSARDQLDEQVSDAIALLERNRFDDAIAVLEAVLNEDPQRAQAAQWATIARARRAFAANDWDAAGEHYRALLALQANHSEARERLAQLSSRAVQPGFLGRLFGRRLFGRRLFGRND